MHQEDDITCGIPPIICNKTESNLEEPSDKSKSRDILQNNYFVIFEMSISSKTKDEFPD